MREFVYSSVTCGSSLFESPGPMGRLAPVCALNRSEWIWGVVGREGAWPEGKEQCHRLWLGSGSCTANMLAPQGHTKLQPHSPPRNRLHSTW